MSEQTAATLTVLAITAALVVLAIVLLAPVVASFHLPAALAGQLRP